MNLLLRIFSLLAVALTGLQFTSCTDTSDDAPAVPDSDCISLEVNVPLVSSRAGDDSLNEFTVNRLHLYFYTKAGHDDDSSLPAYDVAIEGGFEYSRHITLPLPNNALKEGGLFGLDGAECYLYAVANVDVGGISMPTVSNLKSIIVSSSFDKTQVQPEFAMDGLAELTLDRNRRIVTGSIALERAAAKLTLAVSLPQSIDVEVNIVNPFDGSVQVVNTEYFSRADEMRVWISNGVKQSELNVPARQVDDDCLYSNEISNADGKGSGFTFDNAQTKYSYVQSVPFYSYPSRWNAYSPQGNCFLTLMIPWYYKDDTGNIRNIITYYRLAVEPNRNTIERNTFYDMRVTISRLGGISVQKPVDMLFDWNYNMQWNVQTLPTDIKEIRYLLLNNNDFSAALNAYYYEMENEDEISIPFNTSHPVEMESVEMSWYDYKNDASRSITLTKNGKYTYSGCADYAPATNFAGIEIDASKSTLNLKRNIIHISWSSNAPSIKSQESAINAYTFKIRLRHTDAVSGDPSSYATVVIQQIPAICITSQRTTSSNTRFINKNNTTYRTRTGGTNWNPIYSYKGYVNTSNSAPSGAQERRYWLGSYHNESSGYINNSNTYILTISKFAAGDNYIIADPRSRTVDNLNESGTDATAAADWSMADNTRQMQYYYPADRSSDKSRFIAPKLRVASQYGVTYQLYRTGAERRCASYQENGRPAGRWRLPTPAEIEYICRLSNKQYIPYLFGSEGGTADYWCSEGAIHVNNSTTDPSVTIVTAGTDDRKAVRCVYDEWFWESDTLTNKTTFTWGDRARSISGN